MKRILLKNMIILKPGKNSAVIEDAYITVCGAEIEKVGSGQLDESGFDIVYDMSGKYVLPGMINAHHHLYSSLALGMPFPSTPPKTFVEKLEKVWWKLDCALDEDSLRSSYETGLLESLRAGVTTVIDHHSSQVAIEGSLSLLVETAEKFGVSISPCFELTDRNGADGFARGLSESLDTFNRYSDSTFVAPMLGLHASFTLEDRSLERIGDILNEDEWGIHIHLAEDLADHEDAVKRGYRSVVDRLSKFKLLNGHGQVIHGIHINQDDVDLLLENGMKLVHNPTSNANNRVGTLANDTINRLNSGLGTDGMQGNLLAEAKEGTLIRSNFLSAGQSSIDYVSLLFDNNPAIASDLFGLKIGKIEPGYLADIAFYDYYPRTVLDKNNLSGHLLFGFGIPTDVMTGGQFRIKENNFTEIDESEILGHSRIESRKLWDKMS